MALDPSIPLKAGQGVAAPNPLDTVGKVVGIGNALANNRLIGIQSDTADQGLALKRMQVLGVIAGGALSRVPGIDANDPSDPDGTKRGGMLVDALHLGLEGAVKNGVLDRGTYDHLMQGIAGTKDPRELVAKVKQFALMGIEPNAALTRIYGAPGSVSDGQNVQPGVVNDPFMGGGFRAAGQAIPQYPSRSELATRVPGPPGPGGAPTTLPLGAVTPPSLGGPAVSPLGDGRLPPALRNPANAPAQPAPPMASPTGQVTTGIGPAQSAAESATGSRSAERLQEIVDQGVQARSQDAILGNMQAEVSQFTPGPGQDRIKNAQAVALRWFPSLAQSVGIDPKSVAANMAFDKLAAQIADAQGAKSDARLAVTQAANPSSSLTPAGIDLILKQLRGNADYLKARSDLAAQWPNKADHAGFEAQVGKNLDPRAFQYHRLDPEQKRAYVQGIKDPKDQAAFINSYRWAQGQGLLNAAR